MAGAETDVELLGSPRYGLGDVGQGGSAPARDDAHAMLVRRHRARIERVAKALVAKTTLSAKQIDKLAGRSVNDVKVNAPVLLEMHAMDARKRSGTGG